MVEREKWGERGSPMYEVVIHMASRYSQAAPQNIIVVIFNINIHREFNSH